MYRIYPRDRKNKEKFMKIQALKVLIAITVLALFGFVLASPVVAGELKETVASESFSVFKHVNSEDVKTINDSKMDEVIGAGGPPEIILIPNAEGTFHGKPAVEGTIITVPSDTIFSNIVIINGETRADVTRDLINTLRNKRTLTMTSLPSLP
jgi:hypothetical protein